MRKVASLIKSKRGLSQVVTTLILLVVSVLLAGVVTYYATNITMTRTEQEEVDISKAHIWVNGSTQVAAFMVENLGGRDILIDKITVRGVECSWSNVYFERLTSAPSADMNVTRESLITGSSFSLYGKTYDQASTDIPVASSGVVLFYIKNPDNIDLDDVGTTVSITVFTKDGQYIEEVNVESATST
ncbi:hypothetical protein DRO42_01090 [Candidatus Bathyarchaeota archaeon]|nr:MAG: hypothetical protein DRO42_01090 [Candidatus Bathyarchaeota archaeon]